MVFSRQLHYHFWSLDLVDQCEKACFLRKDWSHKLRVGHFKSAPVTDEMSNGVPCCLCCLFGTGCQRSIVPLVFHFVKPLHIIDVLVLNMWKF